MTPPPARVHALLFLALLLCRAGAPGSETACSILPGRPTDHSIVLNIVLPKGLEARVDCSTPADRKGLSLDVPCGTGSPVELPLDQLQPGTGYQYRVSTRPCGSGDFQPAAQGTFHTARRSGDPFTFSVQGDSHPERRGKMFDADLYAGTLRRVASEKPDFHILMGDDFSIERLIESGTRTAAAVNNVYERQRGFLDSLRGSVPVFLVNGNHEQEGRYLLDGTPDNFAALAARARNSLFAMPETDGFYSADTEQVPGIGLLRDYYAFTWGDALFVVIDPYWHSTGPVDNEAGARAGTKKRGQRNLWDVTLGDTQYHWLEKTLSESKAQWKFVFCHHVLGTGRGGVEQAGSFEWGGHDRRGRDQFKEMRPGWALPIHDLFVKTGVTIFFQGHDHLYARQEKDGVVYQSCPNPADPTYQAFNREAYQSGTVLPNSGHLRVRVEPSQVRLEYVRSFLRGEGNDGEVAAGYVIQPKVAGIGRKP